MWFSKQLPTSSLIDVCRTMRHSLGAGLSLLDVTRTLTKRGEPPVRPVAARMAAGMEKGDSLEEVLGREKDYFPPLLLDLAVVGEQTGNLPEIFGELEKYYRMQQSLTRQFRSQIFLPVLQFHLALFIITGMLFVLGAIAESRNTAASDPTGLGFKGKGGALLFLVFGFGLTYGAFAGYLLLNRSLRQKAAVDDLLLRLPVIGPCLEAFALGRFTLALRLTLNTGMPITRALRLSLRATGNAAYQARTPVVVDALKKGEDLTLALTQTKLFPEDFRNIVAVAEESGSVPEVMEKQAQYYQEEAGRRLKNLARVAGWSVWLIYAVFMVFMIMRLAGSYLSALGGG
jgi:type IV pilus assembly protein PilC